MTARLNFDLNRDRNVFGAMINLGATVRRSGLEHSLLHLIKVRVSQINGCAYCIDMHTKDARADGETEQRLYMLNAWRETSLYSERERAGLAWAEAVTRLEGQHVPDEVFQTASKHFSDAELIALTLGVVEINGWNRFSIAFQFPAGDYQPGSIKIPGADTSAAREPSHA
jgi:AhpD family alkylhydroperoxidase